MPKPADHPITDDSNTAVAERPWKMPSPQRGQSVIFHRLGLKNQATDVLAVVLAVSPVNVELSVNGIVYESVRHCDDPKAKSSPEIRSNGTWDFNEHDKTVEARLARLEQLLLS